MKDTIDNWVATYGKPVLHFTVQGPPCGFISSGSRNWSKRQAKAWAYASDVRSALLEYLMGDEVEVDHRGELATQPVTCDGEKATLIASKKRPLFIGTVATFVNGVHPDPENVHKLVKDALFHKVKGGDKWTGGVYDHPRYDKDEPGVEVLVWEAA